MPAAASSRKTRERDRAAKGAKRAARGDPSSERPARKPQEATNAPPESYDTRAATIRGDQHALIIGVNGSGKSTLAAYLGSRFSRVLVVDTKELDPAAAIANATEARGFDAAARAMRSGASRIVYRVPREEMSPDATLPEPYRRRRRVAYNVDRLLELAWAQGGCWCFVLMELADLADESWCPLVLDETIRKGRFVHIALLMCTTAPRLIPRHAIRESKNLFVFTVIDLDDRRRLAEFGGPLELVPLDFSFVHRDERYALRRFPALARV